jgi:hypothetical protein
MALFFTDYSRPLAGLRDGPWKFVYELDTARGRLFDLSVNGDERTDDLSLAHHDRATWYADVLRGWSAAQKSLILNCRAEDR